MTAILAELAVSWLILWILQKKGLAVLGFKITKKRLSHFLFGLLVAAISCEANRIGASEGTPSRFRQNDSFWGN